MQSFLRCGVAAAALTLAATTAFAQDITLKLAHPLPATHHMWTHSMQPFTEAVTEQTGGKVAFEVYPANQLGKDYLGLLNSGLADVVMVIGYYAPDKFPLMSVTELPGMFTTACEATAKYWDLAKPGGMLAEKEYKPLGLHILFVSGSPPYNLMTTERKVETVEDAVGLKVWGNGSATDKSLRAVGAVPVRITAPELYDSMIRGTVDGAAFPLVSVPQYKLEEKIKYMTEGAPLGGGSWFLAMNDRGWEALPEDVKASMTQAAPQAQANLCKFLDAEYARVSDEMVKNNGWTVTQLSGDVAAAWHEKLKGVTDAWAAEMDAKGKDGTALVEAMRNAGGGQ